VKGSIGPGSWRKPKIMLLHSLKRREFVILLPTVGPTTDVVFLARMVQAREWIDLELLLRTLKELHVRPLILSMPIPGKFWEHWGVSWSACQVYYNSVCKMARRHNCSLADFADHETDTNY
jgi:poly-D-alanine transfer protein DltD